MRQLYPRARKNEVDLIYAYGRPSRLSSDQPAVRLNMIASVDGIATLAGRSGALSGPADQTVFTALRTLADTVLVGAGTLRTEQYGPVLLDAEARRRRETWGLPPVPPIAVMTRSCRLDWNSPFFIQAEQRPIVLTTSLARPADRERAAAVADLVITGATEVEPAHAIAALADRGVQNVLLEGGPSVNAQMAMAGLIDELCLTISPLLVGNGTFPILDGSSLTEPVGLTLKHVFEADGYLFLHYRR